LTKPAKQIINWRIKNNPQGCKQVTMRQGAPNDDEKLAVVMVGARFGADARA